jgi:hypothetical protein
MTNKVAFMNENDNDYHLDLQLFFKKYILFIAKAFSNKKLGGVFLLIAFYCKVKSKDQ